MAIHHFGEGVQLNFPEDRAITHIFMPEIGVTTRAEEKEHSQAEAQLACNRCEDPLVRSFHKDLEVFAYNRQYFELSSASSSVEGQLDVPRQHG
jgi:hypothetical protein